MTGKQQFLQTGLKLFGSKTKLGKRAYSDMETVELIKKQEIAEEWLKLNTENPKYPEALKRYEEICNQIAFKLLNPKTETVEQMAIDNN